MSGDPDRMLEEPFWRRRDWWRRVGRTTGGVWVASLLAILATIVTARALGPGDYGSVFLALSMVGSIAILLDVTLEEATVFYGNRALAAGDEAGLRALVGKSLRLDVVVGIAVTAAIVAASEPLADFASAGALDPTLIQISAIGILLTTADSTAHAVLALAGRPDLRAAGMAGQAGFRLLGALMAAQIGGPEAFALSYALGGAVGSLVIGRMAWKVGWRAWRPVGRGAQPATTWQLVRFAFHTSLATTMQAASGTIVPIFLGRTAGTVAVGIFRFSCCP